MNNESHLEKNLSALSEKHPQLAERIRKIEKIRNCRLIKPPHGFPNVLIGNKDSEVLFYDFDDPMQSAVKYMDCLEIKQAPIVFFLGMGLGYHLDYFIRNLGEKWGTREIVVYESDPELFRLALSIADFTNILKHPNIQFFVGEAPEESYYTLRTKIFVRELYHLRSIKIIPLPASVSLNLDYYAGAVSILKKAACQVMVLVGNDSFDSLVGLENMFINIRHIFSHPGIIECFGKFKGRPGVLVAAGPSLNKNMDLLKDLREKALIFSCDTSLIPLMKKKIRPHLVSSLERIPGTEMYYSGLPDLEGIYYVAMAVLMPETIDAFAGRKLIGYRNYPHYGWLEKDKGSIICGMSVANLGFRILELLGCDPIILIGQDLAYGESGDTHVKGNIYGARDTNLAAKPFVELEGNDGRLVKSERGWLQMKFVYEENIADFPGTVINATEGGAKIRGAQVMKFREAIEKYCLESFHPQAILDECYDRGCKDLNPMEDMTRMYNKSKKTRETLEDLIEDFETAVQDARLVEAEVIQPFLENPENFTVPLERLLAIEEKWVELSDAIFSGREMIEMNCQTVQAYDVWMASELSFLKDIYSDKEILSMARVQKMIEWMCVIGSLLVFTRNILKRSEEEISKELMKNETDTLRQADYRR